MAKMDSPSTNTAAPESTGEKQDGRFKPGQSGNPTGRPRGSRNRIVQTLVDTWDASLDKDKGEALELLRKRDPGSYIKQAMKFVPTKVESMVEAHVTHELSEEYKRAVDFADAFRVLEMAQQRLGAKPMVIDITPNDKADEA